MPEPLPPLLAESAALSVAGDRLRRHEMGAAVIVTGTDATVVTVALAHGFRWARFDG